MDWTSVAKRAADGGMEQTLRPSFGTLLRQHRHRLGLTQEELAERSELSVRQLAYLERDRHVARPGTVRRLADALALSDEQHVTLLAANEATDGAGQPTLTYTLHKRLHSMLPIQPPPFIGREQDVAFVVDLLRREDVRLLTLTGPGGIGKTRLAIQAAEAQFSAFPEGVVFLPLGALTDPASVASNLATSLNVKDRPGKPVSQALIDALRDQRLLLLLDNFEHLLPAARLVSEMLTASPQLKVLVTSREVLHLAAEHVYVVPPLELPNPGNLPALDTTIQYDAVSLFVHRARAASASFALTLENAPAVVEICRRLDGLPLAIELAAARIRHFPPQALLSELRHSLRVLDGGPLDVPARQQTLRAAIDWSYNLLDDAEKRLFARLSVFAGGCSLPAVDAVCAPREDLGLDTIAGLESLLERHLIRQVGNEALRIDMLETIRAYACERLAEQGDREEMGRRHAHWVADIVSAVPKAAGKPMDERAFHDEIEREHDNIDEAMHWALDRRDVHIGLVIATETMWPRRTRLRHGEAKNWLRRFLALEGDAPPDVRGRALIAGALVEPDPQQERVMTEEGIRLTRSTGDPFRLLQALDAAGSGRVWLRGIDDEDVLEQTAAWLTEALSLARSLGATNTQGSLLRSLGAIEIRRGNYAAFVSLVEDALELERQSGNHAGVAYCLHSLAYQALHRDEPLDTLRLGEEALEIYMSRGEVRQGLFMRELLAKAHLALGSPEAAVETQRMGIRSVHPEMGFEGLATWFQEIDPEGIAGWLHFYGELLAVAGQLDKGARLVGAARAALPLDGHSEPRHEWELYAPVIAAARERMRGERWNASVAQGRSLRLRDALCLALNEGA